MLKSKWYYEILAECVNIHTIEYTFNRMSLHLTTINPTPIVHFFSLIVNINLFIVCVVKKINENKRFQTLFYHLINEVYKKGSY